jgi:hypothetical protein
MASAAELRAEAARLRRFVDKVTDPAESAAIMAMIEELEGRAKAKGNGDATEDRSSLGLSSAWHRSSLPAA